MRLIATYFILASPIIICIIAWWVVSVKERKDLYTKLIVWKEDFTPDYDVTECCEVGPITNENFCPKCGKKIKR